VSGRGAKEKKIYREGAKNAKEGKSFFLVENRANLIGPGPSS
jgi:hypothetical protein